MCEDLRMYTGVRYGYSIHPWIERGYVLRDVISKFEPALTGVSCIILMIDVTFKLVKIEQDETMIYSLLCFILFHCFIFIRFSSLPHFPRMSV